MHFIVRVHSGLGSLLDVLPVPNDVPLSNVCRVLTLAGARNMEFVNAYWDSLVSYGQLETWLMDIPKLVDTVELSPAEVGFLRELLDFVELARRFDGYLYIEGDTMFNPDWLILSKGRKSPNKPG